MRYTKFLLLSVAIIFSSSAKAQKDTSSRINVFGGSTVFRGSSSTRTTQAKNIIKINPLLFINGDIPIYYERVVNKFMTVEIAPGLTYRDFWGPIYNEADVDTFLSLPFETNAQYGLGYSFKIDVKFFPGKDNLLDGFYLSPEIGYRHYSMSYVNYDVFGNPNSIYSPGHTNVTDIKLLAGDEEESDNIDNFYKDLYYGIGVRYISALYYGMGQQGFTYFTQQKSKASWQPTLYLGLRIGIGVK